MQTWLGIPTTKDLMGSLGKKNLDKQIILSIQRCNWEEKK